MQLKESTTHFSLENTKLTFSALPKVIIFFIKSIFRIVQTLILTGEDNRKTTNNENERKKRQWKAEIKGKKNDAEN